MKIKQKFSLISVIIMGICLFFSIPASLAIAHRTVLNGKIISSINKFLETDEPMTGIYWDENDPNFVSFIDENNEVYSYLSSLNWERSFKRPASIITNCSLIRIFNKNLYMEIFDCNNVVSICWSDEYNYFSAYSYYKISTEFFIDLKGIILND